MKHDNGERPYTLLPIHPVGAEVQGVMLADPVDTSVIQKLIKDVHQYKLLIFRNQGEVSGERQIEITQWFGEVETAGFDLHPKAPDRRILRVSNDDDYGFTGFGTSGFHVDGSFMEAPNNFSIYHMVQAPTQGETVFVSLNDVYNGLSRKEKTEWKRLAMLKTFKRIRGFQDHPGQVIHPLVYRHPATGHKTLCISLGKMSRFIRDMGTSDQVQLSKEETSSLIDSVNAAICRDSGHLLYRHYWQTGDFIISDNLAVGHLATEGTQRPPSEVGLRIMHRTVTVGTARPKDLLCRPRNIADNRCTLL